ncbi:gamma-glutamyltransferase [Streptomyces sp. NPDC055055]
MIMQPPHDVADFAFSPTDALDIPVVVRDFSSLRRPSEPLWRGATQPWPGVADMPSYGTYLATTTWRQVLLAATGVGRDLTPWLRHTPWLAVNELISRIAPLHSYLQLKDVPAPAPAAGRRLFVNALYQYGSERSAHSAFGYHLGMTMAHWLCAGMAGLGSTWHLEARGPGGLPGFTDPTAKLPDLWGNHQAAGLPWLIEAKAARALGAGVLKNGRIQLDGGSALMSGIAHRQVLCGTSLPGNTPGKWEQDHLFLALHTAHPHRGPQTSASPVGNPQGDAEDHLADDPEALMTITRQQLLTYQALAFGAVEQRRIVPMRRDRTERGRHRTGSLTLLEYDEATTGLRHRLQAQQVDTEANLASHSDATAFITGRIPGTGIHLGLSRRLYAACAALHLQQSDMPDTMAFAGIPHLNDSGFGQAQDYDEAREQYARQARQAHYEQEQRYQTRVREAVTTAFRRAQTHPEESRLTDTPLPVRVDNPDKPLLLEAATAESYLALEPTDPVLSTIAHAT